MDSTYKNYVIRDQTFIGDEEKRYDVINILLPDNSKKEIWFDISDFDGNG